MRSEARPYTAVAPPQSRARPSNSLRNGFNHRALRLLVPPAPDLQMAAEAVLRGVFFHDRRVPGGAEGSGAVRAPGDGAWGRELLRLRLGECMETTAWGCCCCCWWWWTTCTFVVVFAERNRNPDVSQRHSDDEEQESKWVSPPLPFKNNQKH